MKTPRKAIVSKRVSEDEKLNAARWCAFIKASTLAYGYLTEEWLDFFSAQSDPTVAGTELIRLIDIAIAKDEKK